MNTYRVTAHEGVTYGVGTILALTPAQAARRAAAIEHVKALGDDLALYRVTAPVAFKRGETLGVEGTMPKAKAELIEDVAAAQQAAKARKQTKAAATAADPAA